MKNLTYLFFVISILFINGEPLFAQIESDVVYGGGEERPSLTNSLPQRGIYQSFQDLKKNNPSIQQPFQEQSRSGRVITYRIRYEANNKREKNAYGFSDGQSIYVNARNYGGGNYYVKSETRGRFLFFRDEGGSGIGLGGGIGIGPVAIGTGSGNRIRAYVLDMKNGTIERLNAKQMKIILSSDSALLRDFEEEKQKNNPAVLFKYIHLYNEKHPLVD